MMLKHDRLMESMKVSASESDYEKIFVCHRKPINIFFSGCTFVIRGAMHVWHAKREILHKQAIFSGGESDKFSFLFLSYKRKSEIFKINKTVKF